MPQPVQSLSLTRYLDDSDACRQLRLLSFTPGNLQSAAHGGNRRGVYGRAAQRHAATDIAGRGVTHTDRRR